MNTGGSRGFRPGVRIATSRRATTLLELVVEELAKAPPPSRLNALDLIDLGAVYVNDGRSLNPNHPLKPGDTVRIHTEPRRFTPPTDLLARILSETDDYLVLEKPPGLPVEPLVDNVKENLISFLEDLRGQRLFFVHRLDPESEGLLAVAKSQTAAAKLSKAFAEGRVKRLYAVYTESPISVQGDDVIRILSINELNAETNVLTENRTMWEIKGAPIQRAYRLEIEFTKARPKEIRSFFASLGTPIIGDRAMGSARELLDPRTGKHTLALKALSLSFEGDRSE